MWKRVERLLPHAVILIGNMYVVFFLIDRVNPAMNFIDNGLTKGLLLLLCAVALVNALRVLRTPVVRARQATATISRGGRPQDRPSGRSRTPAGAGQAYAPNARGGARREKP